MQRCPHCQFPVAHKAKMCGWCGATVRGALPAFLFQRQRKASPGRHAGSTPPSSLVGIPGMGPLVGDPPTNGAITAPARSTPASATSGASLYETVMLAESWPGTITLHQAFQATTSALPYSATPLPTPPPPQLALSSGVDRWWWLGLALLPLLTWALTQHDQFWSDALQATARVCFIGGATISMWLLYRRMLLGHAWRVLLIPAVVGLMLIIAGGMASALAQPADMLQGQQAEHNGDDAKAVAIYQHAGDASDAAHAQIAWGSKLIDQHDYVAAKQHLTTGLATASGPVRDDGHAALGRLYWQWGQMSLQQGQVADARAEWTLATVQAAGTPDGDRAATALDAPQNVTGHVIWLGQPMPALRVALISNWAYLSSSQSLQSSGDRLEATTGDDGAFTIVGAKPGVTYALIWVGTFGDTTRVDAQGNPLYTVKVRSLESTAIGTVDIGTPTLSSAGDGPS